MQDETISSSKEILMQLEVEKELRARSEIREEGERRERIAAAAQLLATQSECNTRLRDVEEKWGLKADNLQLELSDVIHRRDALMEEVRTQADLLVRSEIEVQQLRLALDNQHASASTDVVEQLAKVSGENEVLNRHMREMTALKVKEENNRDSKIRELEDQLRAGEAQRRKLHNLVQELRGNVRVFARVRPFLPSGNSYNLMVLKKYSVTLYNLFT